jgi:hypothetical protein
LAGLLLIGRTNEVHAKAFTQHGFWELIMPRGHCRIVFYEFAFYTKHFIEFRFN